MLTHFTLTTLAAAACLGLSAVGLRAGCRRTGRRLARWAAVAGGAAGMEVGACLLMAAVTDAVRVAEAGPQVEAAVRQGLADRYGEPPREVEVHPVAWGDRYAGTAAVAGRRVTISARLVVEGGELRAVWESAPADPLPKE